MSCHEKQQGCQRSENLKGKPQDCSAEQIRQCHGDSKNHACIETVDCEHPERLKGKPGECSPERLRQCHGSGKGHPCATR